MKSTAGVVRSPWNDGAKGKSTGFSMHHQMYQDALEKPHYKDVKRIHMEMVGDVKVQVGTINVHGASVKVFKTKDYPAWRELNKLKESVE